MSSQTLLTFPPLMAFEIVDVQYTAVHASGKTQAECVACDF